MTWSHDDKKPAEYNNPRKANCGGKSVVNVKKEDGNPQDQKERNANNKKGNCVSQTSKALVRAQLRGRPVMMQHALLSPKHALLSRLCLKQL